MSNPNPFSNNKWSRPNTSTYGFHNSWYQSKSGRHLRRRQQLDFIQRELRREKEAKLGSCIKQISKDCKEMLKKKMEEIMQYNNTINQPQSINNAQNIFRRYKCFHCKQRGHILKFCDTSEKCRTFIPLCKIGIRALSYKELGCISDMSNSDELRHTDNTTMVSPRLPDTLPQVYHRRRPTQGLLILPSVSPFPPTIRRTARISIPPIEPNLAERARISAVNLDDYQLDHVTPPPSPSSPFTIAAYQRMIAETDPTQREKALTETSQNSVPVPETALTVCTTRLRGQLHTILEDMDRYPNACLEELEAFMTLWDVKLVRSPSSIP
ncbi:hypothetical protein Tco_0456551 [Tanacetum coccineum]